MTLIPCGGTSVAVAALIGISANKVQRWSKNFGIIWRLHNQMEAGIFLRSFELIFPNRLNLIFRQAEIPAWVTIAHNEWIDKRDAYVMNACISDD